MSVTNPEAEGAKIERYVKWGFGFIAAGVAAPMIYGFAMDIMEAMWALAGLAGSAMILWMVGPAVATYAANKRIALLKAAAAEDPIATMDNVIMEKQGELHTQEEQVITVDEQWGKVKKIVASLMKTDPDEAKSMKEAEDLLEQASTELHAEYTRAVTALDAYIHARDKASRLWDASVAINNALKIAGTARSKALQKLKSDVAFETVSNNMDQAFARLKMAVQKHKEPQIVEEVVEGEVVAPKAITEGPAASNIVNISQLREKSTRKVGNVNG